MYSEMVLFRYDWDSEPSLHVAGPERTDMTPDEQRIHDRRWLSLVVLAGSLMVITLDNTILNVAIPSLVKDLDASLSELQWIIDGYTLVFAGLLLTAGALGDRFGRKGALQIGLAIFGLASMASALASTPMQLTLCRAAMGVGGALIMPSTLSLLTNLFRDPRERGRAIGVWAAVAGASGALGPVLGGVLLKYFSWHSVFLINVPIIIVLLIAGRSLLPSSKAPGAARLDPLGAVLSIVGLTALLWAVIETPTYGWTSTNVLISFSIGMAALGAFVAWQLHTDHPMLDVRFFKDRRFTAANLAITLVYFAMFGQMFVMSQYMQVILGYSPLEAGLRMMPMSVMMLCIAPFAPRLVEKFGTKLVVGVGLLSASFGVFYISNVPVTNGYLHLLTGVMFLAAGMGLTMAPATESIMGSLPPAKAGVGSAMNDTTRQVGGALGVAVLGSILAAVYQPGVESKLTAIGISPTNVAAATESIGSAIYNVVPTIQPDSLSAQVAEIASTEYVNGIHVALKVGSFVIFLAALVVFKWLPARAKDVREHVSGPLDGIASLTYAEAEGVLEDDQLEIDALESGSAATDGGVLK
jgi:EmrB/QacA subfamily drug resistance transporter